MKYTIISTVLILKPPLFMCKTKVGDHVFVYEVFSILPLIIASVFFFVFHIIDTKTLTFFKCASMTIMVPKII